MGGSSVTTGYKYYMDLHFIVGLARGGSASTSTVKDGLMEITGADRVAWSGLQTENGSIVINAPNLFGGDKKEGGLFGPAEILFGGPDQPPNPYLTFRQGGTQPGYRNVFSVVYKQGLVACNNPYIKPWSFLRRRITGDWYGGECWYEAKAPIRLIDGNSGTMTRDGLRGPTRSVPHVVRRGRFIAVRRYGSDSISTVVPSSSNGPTTISTRSPGTSSVSVTVGASARRPPSPPITRNGRPPSERRT